MPIERFSSRREALGPVLSTRLKGATRYLRIAGYFRSSLLEVVGESLETVDEIYEMSSEEGWDDLDYAATLGLLEKWAGIGKK